MRSTSVPVDPAVRRRRRLESAQRSFDDITGQLEDAKARLDSAPRGSTDERELRLVVSNLRTQVDKARRTLSRARVAYGRPS